MISYSSVSAAEKADNQNASAAPKQDFPFNPPKAFLIFMEFPLIWFLTGVRGRELILQIIPPKIERRVSHGAALLDTELCVIPAPEGQHCCIQSSSSATLCPTDRLWNTWRGGPGMMTSQEFVFLVPIKSFGSDPGCALKS